VATALLRWWCVDGLWQEVEAARDRQRLQADWEKPMGHTGMAVAWAAAVRCSVHSYYNCWVPSV
jgi:hypothetical protein